MLMFQPLGSDLWDLLWQCGTWRILSMSQFAWHLAVVWQQLWHFIGHDIWHIFWQIVCHIYLWNHFRYTLTLTDTLFGLVSVSFFDLWHMAWHSQCYISQPVRWHTFCPLLEHIFWWCFYWTKVRRIMWGIFLFWQGLQQSIEHHLKCFLACLPAYCLTYMFRHFLWDICWQCFLCHKIWQVVWHYIFDISLTYCIFLRRMYWR